MVADDYVRLVLGEVLLAFDDPADAEDCGDDAAPVRGASETGKIA